MLAITDASAGADPLGYVISMTNDVVTVRSEQDGAERDYNTAFNTAFLQPYVGGPHHGPTPVPIPAS